VSSKIDQIKHLNIVAKLKNDKNEKIYAVGKYVIITVNKLSQMK